MLTTGRDGVELEANALTEARILVNDLLAPGVGEQIEHSRNRPIGLNPDLGHVLKRQGQAELVCGCPERCIRRIIRE